MAVVGGAHLACAKGRETRADASCSRNSIVVDTTSEDRAVIGCDAGVTVSQTGDRYVGDRRVERSAEVHTTTDVSGSFLTTRPSPVRWEASLDPWVQTRVRGRKASQTCSGYAELGADVFVPEGDASEPLYLARDTSSMPRRQSQVSFGKGSSSPQGAEGRQASKRGCLHRSWSDEADGG
jgi:hypothetical protein